MNLHKKEKGWYVYEYCERPNWLKCVIKWKECTSSIKCTSASGKVLKREEGKLTTTGAVSVLTGKYTGRSPKDKFIVNEASTADKIDWGTIKSSYCL